MGKNCGIIKQFTKFPQVPMGALTPGSAHARPSAQFRDSAHKSLGPRYTLFAPDVRIAMFYIPIQKSTNINL